ncbi:hypothetical protein ACMX2H_15965 [Arthrobacter sulfonylureivorans]|uniref:hypothetical protein n=1 Tax=Arthrobacter sulfonylureivorans TaxID=2486855 RepID=UPI0039E6FD67
MTRPLPPLAIKAPRVNYHPKVLESFTGDTDQHGMNILLDQGVYRHVRFQKESGSSMYWFDLITTPGLLTINGDMGTYTFSREHDMFPWFNSGYVNEGYWSQKLRASDHRPNHSIREFDDDTFRRFVIEDFWERRVDESPVFAAAVWRAIKDELIGVYVLPDDQREAIEKLDQFDCGGWTYSEPWEHDFTKPDYTYLWNLHAILWGIQRYYAAKEEQP